MGANGGGCWGGVGTVALLSSWLLPVDLIGEIGSCGGFGVGTL
jgi:hypothetical protein